jgi:hypothetical protein
VAVTPSRDTTTDTGRGKSISKCLRKRRHIDIGHRPEVPSCGAPSAGSAAGDEGHDDVRRVTVEVLSTAVIDGRRAGIGVTSGDLHIA